MLLLLLACAPYKLFFEDPDTAGPSKYEPSIVLSASNINFGSIVAPGEVSRLLAVTNRGLGLLEIFSIDVDSPFGFELDQVTINSGQTEFISVLFTPDQHGFFNSQLTIDSNDGWVSIDLEGEGIAAQLMLSPSNIIFEGPGNQGVSIYNAGNAATLVTNIELDSLSDELSLSVNNSSYGPLPWSIGSEEVFQAINLAYQPVNEGEDKANILVTTYDHAPEILGVVTAYSTLELP